MPNPELQQLVHEAIHREAVGDYPGAIAACRSALLLDDTLPELHYIVGCCLMKLNQSENAEAALGRAVALRPDYIQALNNLGIVQFDSGRFAAAANTFSQAVAADPTFARGHCNLGNALFAQQRYAEALGAYRSASALQPGYAKALRGAADCYLALGDVEGAFGEVTLLSNVDERQAEELLQRILPDQ